MPEKCSRRSKLRDVHLISNSNTYTQRYINTARYVLEVLAPGRKVCVSTRGMKVDAKNRNGYGNDNVSVYISHGTRIGRHN